MTEQPELEAWNTQDNSSFSKTIPNLQIAWDSTSFGTFKECPRKYYYTMILGRQPRDESVHLVFGAHYHKALEVYDHMRSRGKSHDDAQLEAVRYCLEGTVTRLPSGGFRPWMSDSQHKNRWTLTRSVVWYLEQFKDDPLETIQLANGKPAVELSFRYDSGIPSPDGSNFYFCGHIDRLVRADEQINILDRKTTKNTIYPETFQKYSPDNQMSLYDFSGQVVWKVDVKRIILDIAQVAVTFTRFQRGFTHRTPKSREEWYGDANIWLAFAGECAVQDYWPMNDKSCNNYGGCPFQEICAKGPETRGIWLPKLTKPRKWDPLKVRGDI